MPYRRKPKALKTKNIKRKTGARAQSKQIVALSKQVSSLTKSNYETVQTIWYRNNLSVDKLTGGTVAYVCPMPKSMCNCFSQDTIETSALVDQRLKFSDNLAIAAQQYFQKSPVFGSSDAARESHEANHMGGLLKWRLISDEPAFSTYSIFLISPKNRQADQLITDRNLKASQGGGSAGSGAFLMEGTDFITHPDVMGSQINKKFWNIDYHKEVNFSHPGASSASSNRVSANNTNPLNNAIIATGTIRLKPGGTLKCYNRQLPASSGNPDMGYKAANASQIGFIDEKNEKTQYLVIINNGVSADLETVNLSLLVRDYYKVVV